MDVNPLDVACPWSLCEARTGHPCTRARYGDPRPHVARVRWAVARLAARDAVIGWEGDIPVVAARRPDPYHLVIDCPLCGRQHQHGCGGPGAPFGYGDGHRVSRCAVPVAGKDRGYILREVHHGPMQAR